MTNSTSCKLLVSANHVAECELLHRLRVPWIDLKEPKHGPLGRPSLETAIGFATLATTSFYPDCHWSIAGGELADWDIQNDTPFLNLLGNSGHIKWGLANCQTKLDWMGKLPDLITQLPSPSQAIVVHYADYPRANAPSWDVVLDVAIANGINKLLIDTAIKDGKTLLDWIPLQNLSKQIETAHGLGLKIALAGSIPIKNLSTIAQLLPDWIGVRGAVCSDPFDRSSTIDPMRVQAALGEFALAQQTQAKQPQGTASSNPPMQSQPAVS